MLRKCRDCGLVAETEEDLELFSKNPHGKYGRDAICLTCKRKEGRENGRIYRKKNKEKLREKSRVHRLKNKDAINARQREWRKNNPERCRELRNKYKEKRREYAHRYNQELKDMILEIFGGKCNCCGEVIPIFLTVDHIHNDGSEERKKYASRTILLRIVKLYEENPEKVFDRYQMLCFNCNLGRHLNGGVCPHKQL